MALLLTLATAAHAQSDAAPESPAPTPKQIEQGYRLAPAVFRDAVSRAMPYVVTIETFGGITGRSALQPKRRPGQRPGRRGGGGAIGGLSKPGEGPTTGVIISPQGHILTSTFNFIRKQQIITVVLPDGSQHVAELLGRDEIRKLCVLKIDGVEDLPTPPIAMRDELRVGQWSISVGVGYGGEDPAISVGIISARNRVGGKAVQTDANISPANYGGPLIDIEGRFIGLCVPLNPRARSTAGGVEWYDSGIGFAIPLSDAEKFIEAMKAGRTVAEGFLGIRASDSADEGIMIDEVAPDSGAAKAGVLVADVITQVNAKPVKTLVELKKELGEFIAGDEVELTILRAEETVKVKVTLQAGPINFAGKKDE